MKVLLQHIAHARSGDKGNTCNIAVFAYTPAFYPLLKAQLTRERFKAHYGGAIKGEVLRYEVDNLDALDPTAGVVVGLSDRPEPARIAVGRPFEPAIVADVDETVRSDGGPVRTSAEPCDVGDGTVLSNSGQGATFDLHEDDRPVRHRDRAFGEAEAARDLVERRCHDTEALGVEPPE